MAKIVTLRSAGIQAVLNSAKVRAMVDEAALTVGVAAESDPSVSKYADRMDVRVDAYTASGGRMIGRRPGAAVVLAGPMGIGVEAKHGPLIRAARTLGVRVSQKNAGAYFKSGAFAKAERKARRDHLKAERAAGNLPPARKRTKKGGS